MEETAGKPSTEKQVTCSLTGLEWSQGSCFPTVLGPTFEQLLQKDQAFKAILSSIEFEANLVYMRDPTSKNKRQRALSINEKLLTFILHGVVS